jgi:hypothetical protein
VRRLAAADLPGAHEVVQGPKCRYRCCSECVHWPRPNEAGGRIAGAVAVATVGGTIALFDNWVPVLSLGVLFVLAVLPIAVVWGTSYAVLVAVAPFT